MPSAGAASGPVTAVSSAAISRGLELAAEEFLLRMLCCVLKLDLFAR
jgi:hypothetical protein